MILRLITPVVTATSIILSFNKIQNGDILEPAYPCPPGIAYNMPKVLYIGVFYIGIYGIVLRVGIHNNFSLFLHFVRSATSLLLYPWVQ